MADKIKSKWDFLFQCRPEIRSMIRNSKLIGGHIGHDSNHQEIFNFITTKGIFTYNEGTEEFERKLEIR